ncbi:hybrid sensor histidine kinase/response regulator [Puteibacter caeruleilacunae]|nr:hybrid sensor histidine kinase/response regulator [Puteibacter caeruleilacunae]
MRALFFSFIFLLGVHVSQAQELYFDHFSVESGLTDNHVSNVVQDDFGYIWLGSLNGLNRYNGYGMEAYLPSATQPGALKGNSVNSVSKGRNGNVWVVTRNGGLNHYDAYAQQFYHFPDSIFPFDQRSIRQIVEDEDGTIRFIVGRSYFSFSAKSRQVTKLLDGVSVDWQYAYSKNINWLIVNGKIKIFNVRNNELQDTPSALSKLKDVRSVTRDPFYEIHILTPEGIYHLSEDDAELGLLIDFKNLKSLPSVDNLECDGDNYWIRSNSKLYRIYKENYKYRIQRVENKPFNQTAFHGTYCRNIFVDSGRNTWITTSKNGVNIYNKRKNQFKHYYPYDLEEGIQNLNPVRALCKTRKGDIWIGFENSGVGYYKHNSSEFHSFDLQGVNIGSSRVIFQDSNDQVFVGTGKGIFCLDEQNNRLVKLQDKFGIHWPHNVYCINEDRHGRIWIGGSRLGYIDTDDCSLHYIADQKVLSVREFSFDGDIVWIASDSRGVIKYNQKTGEMKYYTASVGLSDNKVYTVCVQTDAVWAGTVAGLSRIDKKTGKVINYFQDDGLSNNLIYGIRTDEKKNLWISTAKGISRFDIKKKRFSQYLHDRLFLDDAVSKSADKQILFGGYNGFVVFDPDNIHPVMNGDAPILESMTLMGKKVQVSDENDAVLKQSLEHTNELRLNYEQNNFSFEFITTPIVLSGLTSYRYILDGYQDDWVITTLKDNKAIFTQVPPGNYVLRVRSANEDGVWGGNERRLSIVITPPFWQTIWFNAILLIVFGLLIYAVIKMREQNIKRRNLYLQKEVESKTAALRQQNSEITKQKEEIERMSDQVHEADQAKLRFFTNVSHELKTPLTLILGHLDVLKRQKNAREEKSFNVVRRNALKLLGLVNDIVDFRKAAQGELNLVVAQYNFVALTKSMVDDFKGHAKNRGVTLSFIDDKISTPEGLMLWIDKVKFDKVLSNLLSNAIKYTPQSGSVEVSIEEYDEQVQLKVKDTGIGIAPGDEEKIFDRFYRTDASREEVGHGIGLALVKSFVELHGGTINVHSELGKGSCFIVNFWKGKEHLPKENYQEKISHADLSKKEPLISIERDGKNSDKYDAMLTAVHRPEKHSLQKEGLPSVLIVEDNLELLSFMCNLLQDDYSIETAENGVEALEQLEEFQADLIISDIMMPKMDGITFCQQVKKDIRYSHIPFILLTAKSDLETRIEGFQLGIDDYIEKPFNVELIKVRISALLANRQRLKEELQKGSLIVSDEQLVQTPDKQFLEKVWNVIEQNYADADFSIEFLGKEVGMSRATFFRKFKSLTGQLASDFIKKYRIDRAKKLIEAGHRSVGEVGVLVGYQSPSQFRKAFKELTEVSPSEYIKGLS